jgi:beta-lactamase regulating signal transducer with metallopeptidase domain
MIAHLWQSTLFAGAAALLSRLFSRNGAHVRFSIWFAASIKFLIPFAILLELGGSLDCSPAAHSFAAKVTPTVISFAAEEVAQVFPASSPKPANCIPFILFAAWFCGSAVILFFRGRAWLRIRTVVRSATPSPIFGDLDIRLSSDLLEPGVIGIRHPTVLFPSRIAEWLTPVQFQTVLRHELTHIRRRDNIFAAIHVLVEIVFWFHPFVWWIGARLVEERERACDEEVLKHGILPRDYADAILNVCRFKVELPLICASGVAGADIRKRIGDIMSDRKGLNLTGPKKLILTAAVVVAFTGPVAVGILASGGNIMAIHAQSAVPAPLIPKPVQPKPAAVTEQSAPQSKGSQPLADHRLVAILFDFSAMNSDEQSRARQSGIDFIRNQMKHTDLVAIMTANQGRLSIMQDFNGDRTLLESRIRNLGTISVNPSFTNYTVSSIEGAAKLLEPLTQEKALMYFTVQDLPTNLIVATEAATKADMAIYPIDVRGLRLQRIADNTRAQASLLYPGHVIPAHACIRTPSGLSKSRRSAC